VSPRRGMPPSSAEQVDRAAKQVEKAAERAAEKDAAEAEEQAQAEVDLRVAASRGDKAALAIAEQAGTDIDSTDGLGKSALMWAAMYGHRNCVDYLLSKGANVNARTKSMWTALHWAVTNEHTACAESLIKAGADTSLTDKRGETALDFAKYNSNKGESIPLLDKAVAEMALLKAAENGDLNTLERLVSQGVDIDAVDGVGRTAIMWASLHGNKACIEHLIGKGAKHPKMYTGHI